MKQHSSQSHGSFADDPQRNPMRDDNHDEGPKELYINNPDHPIKKALKKPLAPSSINKDADETDASDDQPSRDQFQPNR